MRREFLYVYWSAADTYGVDVEGGPGWYFRVVNPDPAWIFNDPAGPYTTEEDALEDASCVGQE